MLACQSNITDSRRRRSIPSLIGGLGTAAVFGAAGYLLKQNADWGLELALVGSTLLAGASLPRAIKTQKAVPMGLVVLSALSGAYYGRKYYEFYG